MAGTLLERYYTEPKHYEVGFSVSFLVALLASPKVTNTLILFYKNTLYKNTEARFAQKIRTGLEHAQLQMRNQEKTDSQFEVSEKNRT